MIRRIISREVYERGRCRQVVQEGSCEFVTLIACVNAISKAITPTLLDKGESKDLQDTWFKEIGEED